jgi:hypothetical protein
LCGQVERFFTELFGRWLDQFSTFPLKPTPGLSGPPVGDFEDIEKMKGSLQQLSKE